jgi:hypothetical protein
MRLLRPLHLASGQVIVFGTFKRGLLLLPYRSAIWCYVMLRCYAKATVIGKKMSRVHCTPIHKAPEKRVCVEERYGWPLKRPEPDTSPPPQSKGTPTRMQRVLNIRPARIWRRESFLKASQGYPPTITGSSTSSSYQLASSRALQSHSQPKPTDK